MTRTQTSVVGIALMLLIAALALPFPSSAATVAPKAKKVDTTCMQAAVASRESAVLAGWDSFTDTMHSGLVTRAAALNTAWGMDAGTGRAKALKDAWTAWKKVRKDAHTELKADRKAAWATFKTTVKDTCKVTLPKEESLEKDSSGSLSL